MTMKLTGKKHKITELQYLITMQKYFEETTHSPLKASSKLYATKYTSALQSYNKFGQKKLNHKKQIF